MNTFFNDVIMPLLDSKLPEMMKVDRTDPFFVYRFLQSVYTNYYTIYSNRVQERNKNLVAKIPGTRRAWKGGSAAEYKQHLVDVQAFLWRKFLSV